ncbi:hypothetical protein G6F62_014702 [Rhizopus arrhizus]|nr:hypothetical protein G6F62_014702 [Rhizopus arrhizus]KAG1360535.1 hypothetical protein G6F61_014315 [Rhizopus arrhizus]
MASLAGTLNSLTVFPLIMLTRGSVVLQELHNAHLRVHDDLSLGSDHSPLSLSCLVPPPPPPSSHPRLLWNLSRLFEHDCTYVQLFKDKIRPFLQLLQEYTSADGVYTSFGSVRWPQEP